ncbi:unnamed protein product [Cylindrotheca closterium]|uniref:Tetratricopeptide SHNi-TPR domain-containing protein n=1 Tax=Cylindrotheca closterium TaxID=2856 RepID=A0AAD2FYU1_9STRA|nr:unnamed protein product [Cylindrotheca closterium]
MKRSDTMADESVVAATKVRNLSPDEAYEASEVSCHYEEAKQLLNEGKFEEALASIESGIKAVKDAMPGAAMAPFHYLYGTTLLYQLEESTDVDVTVATETSDENADDMQIAWENLEAARILVEAALSHVLKDATKSCTKTKLELDLAQIALRSADLQRMNGRYSEAIEDYQTCLDLRKLHLDEYDRKIADCFYNIALSNLLACTELQKEATESKNSAEGTSREDRAREHREAGIELYLDCAKTLCGEIAFLCGKQPSDILNGPEFKTSTEEETTTASQKSETLRRWRMAVSSASPSMQGDQNLVDLIQMLDEIQETIDEAEKSQDAIRQASMLKQQARDDVANGKAGADNGQTSAIGFDKPTAAIATKDVDVAGESAKSIMVVRKKKKRKRVEDSEPIAEGKKPKVE